ncbi:unnamed protein product [Umbelopsis ramanniana]
MDPGIDRSNLKKVPNLIYEDPSIVTPIHRSERHPWSPVEETNSATFADIKGVKKAAESAKAPVEEEKKTEA